MFFDNDLEAFPFVVTSKGLRCGMIDIITRFCQAQNGRNALEREGRATIAADSPCNEIAAGSMEDVEHQASPPVGPFATLRISNP